MLRRMLGVTLKDRMKKKVKMKTIVTRSVVAENEVNKLRWYGHVLRKEKDEKVRQAMEEPVKGARSRGHQPRRRSDDLWERREELGLNERDAQDRKKWRNGIQATDPLKKKKKEKEKKNEDS